MNHKDTKMKTNFIASEARQTIVQSLSCGKNVGHRTSLVGQKKPKLELNIVKSEPHIAKSDVEFVRSKFEITKSEPHIIKSDLEITKSNSDITRSESDIAMFDLNITKSELKIVKSGFDITKSKCNLTMSDLNITKSESDLTKSVSDFVRKMVKNRHLVVKCPKTGRFNRLHGKRTAAMLHECGRIINLRKTTAVTARRSNCNKWLQQMRSLPHIVVENLSLLSSDCSTAKHEDGN